MKLRKVFLNGIFGENPVFRLVLGTCPTMAVSLSIFGGLGMGIAATAVLAASNLIIACLRQVIPNEIRIPCFIVVIATFVTIVDQVMHAFVPDLYRVLGIFIPLIVVNCIILARAEAFASRNPILPSFIDGLGMGVGFTIALLLMGSFRELVGAGKLLVMKDFNFPGFSILGETNVLRIFILPPGGFITFGLILAVINWAVNRRDARKEAQE
ncbi:MAG: electron transport complex subunit RsxE [Bacillota bacterium]